MRPAGLHMAFAGHPLLEALAPEKTGARREENLLGLFPGSREREVKRNFPVMVDGGAYYSEIPAGRAALKRRQQRGAHAARHARRDGGRS